MVLLTSVAAVEKGLGKTAAAEEGIVDPPTALCALPLPPFLLERFQVGQAHGLVAPARLPQPGNALLITDGDHIDLMLLVPPNSVQTHCYLRRNPA